MSRLVHIRRLARLRGEDGFSLIELMISVAILGIIAAALCGVVLSYLRNTVDTQARLTESHDVQFAAAYWQRDVASIGVRSATYDTPTHTFPLQQSVAVPTAAALPACPLPAGATPVVTLGWSDYTSLGSTDTPTLVTVTYAARQPAGSTTYELDRVRCGSQPATIKVSGSLTAAPTVTCRNAAGTAIDCAGTGTAVPATVELALQAHDPTGQSLPTYNATLTGERRQS